LKRIGIKILFLGTVEFSRHCLDETLRLGGNVTEVLTLDEKKGLFNSDYADLEPVAAQYGVPVRRIHNINDQETIHHIQRLEPDVIFVFGFSQLIKKEVLDIPNLGCIGTHPALLPKNRGRHPLTWALIDDLKESGLTFFYLDEGADSGDILWQKKFFISDMDDAGTLYGKIKSLASEGIREILPLLQAGNAPRIKQDHSKATYWRKRGEEDGEIDWNGTTRQAFNLIRGLCRPYVGAHTFAGKYKVIIWRSRIVEDPGEIPGYEHAMPGQILTAPDPGFFIRTGEGVLEVLDWGSEVNARMGKGTILKGVKH